VENKTENAFSRCRGTENKSVCPVWVKKEVMETIKPNRQITPYDLL